jgi:hypothetical protein
MIVKHPILPKRVRKVPRGFGWIDHRLVSDKRIDQCTHAASALYLFLVCVGDDLGLSYYGDKSIMERLAMDQETFSQARTNLIRKGLIAWQKPLYQVLSLEPEVIPRKGAVMSLCDILNHAMEVSRD